MRLTHGAWTYTAAAIDALNILGPNDSNFLWLPLSHAFGKVMLALPLQIGFPTAVDGRDEKIIDNLADLHPTIMGAAPRIFEKAHARIEGMIAEQGGLPKMIFDWAIGVGMKVSEARQAGEKPSLPSSLAYKVADTGWCCPPSGSGSVVGCGSSSPRPPLWTAMSRGGSTPSASSCSRVTD